MEDLRKAKNDVLKIQLRGELDHHMVKALAGKIDKHILQTRKRKVLFDFKNVSFMDSSGVGMIIGRYKVLQKLGGVVGVVNLSERMRKIFEMSGLFNIVCCYEDENDAIQRLRGANGDDDQ